jgi:hypothetical protein
LTWPTRTGRRLSRICSAGFAGGSLFAARPAWRRFTSPPSAAGKPVTRSCTAKSPRHVGRAGSTGARLAGAGPGSAGGGIARCVGRRSSSERPPVAGASGAAAAGPSAPGPAGGPVPHGIASAAALPATGRTAGRASAAVLAGCEFGASNLVSKGARKRHRQGVIGTDSFPKGGWIGPWNGRKWARYGRGGK